MKWIRFTWQIVLRTTYDGTLVRASALTYQTLLALVPLFAIMLAIAKGFGLQNLLEQTLQREFRDQEAILQNLLQFSYNTLEQLREGALAVIGLIALFFTVTRLLASFEEALNSMWGIIERRSFMRMISSHISLVLISPLLFSFSSSVSIFLSAQIQAHPEDNLLLEYTRTIFGSLLPAIPYFTIALLFTIFLYALPTRRPQWHEALIAGALASIAYQVLQGTYISLQLEMTKMSAVWGSFVALPLFLAWLWASWAILLVGGQLSVALHEHLWKFSSFQDSITSPAVKLAYMNAIIDEARRSLRDDKQCPSVEQLGVRLQIPQRILNPILQEMQSNHCILIAPSDESHSTYIASLTADATEYKLLKELALPTDQALRLIPDPIQPSYALIASLIGKES